MDADAVEALLELLTAAPTLAERRGYFSVLTKMDTGTERIVHRLNHPDWFVVRNVAELCGELRLAGAVRPLTEQASHRDERVRRAVAGALCKIGSTETLGALRRALPKSALQHIARLALSEGRRVEATAVLKRMDADAVEALLELLTAAPTLAERRGYFSVLTKMETGTERIVHRLSHPDWFVVRNVAELCGELRLAGAVRPLAEQALHRDERVRRAVAGALCKIGSTETLGALRQLLYDVEPMVRLEAAQGLAGEWGRGLVNSIAVRLPEEAHPDVLRELHLALGRLGTAEAVKLLHHAAAPAKGILARKSAAVRVAAVQGLALAGGAEAEGALQELVDDSDSVVRAAAERALSRQV
jgi:HEAT repeat protein